MASNIKVPSCKHTALCKEKRKSPPRYLSANKLIENDGNNLE